jgi:integrase
MAYKEIATFGCFKVCQRVGKPHLYVGTYLADTQKTIYRSLHTTDAGEAIDQVRSLVARGITGDPAAALAQKPLRTIAEVLEFFRPHAEKHKSAEFAAIAIARMIRLMGDQLLQTAVPNDFDRFRDAALGEGISLSTVHRTLSVLRSAGNTAVKNRRLPSHHLPYVPYYLSKNQARSADPKGRVMDPGEIAAAIDKLDFLHLLIAVVYLLNTGSRIGAILDATTAQIDHRYNLFDLNPPGRLQTDKWRPVLPIADTLAPWTHNLAPGHIVTWHHEPVGEIDTGFGAACRRAKLPGGENTYSVRHALGRYMQTKGVQPLEISLWLGHIQPPDSKETTTIYSPFAPSYLSNAKVAVEQFVREIASHCKRHDILNPP